MWLSGCIAAVFASEPLDVETRTSAVAYEHHPFDASKSMGRTRLAQTATFAPLRVKAYYDTSQIPRGNLAHIKTIIMPQAMAFWNTALKVVPVPGALKIEPACPAFWTHPKTETCSVKALGEKCGLTTIPATHLAAQYYCPSCNSLKDGECDPVNCQTAAGGKGLADTDMVMYVTAVHTDTCASGSTLAYAGACLRDQFDRPVAGSVNFCPKALSGSASGGDISTAIQ